MVDGGSVMPVRGQVVTDLYALYWSDTMEVLPEIKTESVDLAVYSPPFPELYSPGPAQW